MSWKIKKKVLVATNNTFETRITKLEQEVAQYKEESAKVKKT
jgi:hypothetical protein